MRQAASPGKLTPNLTISKHACQLISNGINWNEHPRNQNTIDWGLRSLEVSSLRLKQAPWQIGFPLPCNIGFGTASSPQKHHAEHGMLKFSGPARFPTKPHWRARPQKADVVMMKPTSSSPTPLSNMMLYDSFCNVVKTLTHFYHLFLQHIMLPFLRYFMS